MEKLINLLNEYEAERHKTSVIADIWGGEKDRLSYLGLNTHYSTLLCISKGYLFIDWLCHNNKIDFDKVYEKEKAEKIDICIYGRYGKEENTYWLIMLLAVSDSPISDLISYLK